MGLKLFGDHDSAEAGDISKIEIDKAYARRFKHNKKREDLQRFEELKKKGEIEDSEEDDESSDDDDEEIVNYSTKQDLKFFDALIKVRNKDPLLKNNDAKLFDSDNEDVDDENEGGDDKKEKKKKPMFLKDVNAKHLIGNGPEFDDEDDERNDKNRKKSYFEEQEEVRKEFLDAVANEEDDDGEFLKVKNNKDDEDEDGLEYEKKLDEYFKEDDKLDENEKFLKDYFRKKMWLDKGDDCGKSVYDDQIDVSEDEEELEKQEDYERAFNFRYEENAGDIVMGHSRKVEGSVRKKESKRKIQRMSKKERMAQAEFERNEEIKHLKNLKKKEINEKLRKIRETAGIDENGDCALDENDLEEEFDPEEYDRKMQKAFDDKFYEADDADPAFGSEEEDGELEKPNFDEEDDLLGLPTGWDDECGSGDGFLAIRKKTLKDKVKNEENEEELQDEEAKRKRFKLEAELIKKELEEYYKLDCEGTIGDLKTRFKYKPVNKNNYGLKAKEILIVDEKELNQMVPLKKLATYRDDEFIIPRHKRKEQKQRIKSLIWGESSDGHTNGSKRPKQDVGQTETEKPKSDAENEDQKELSRKQRRKMRLKELKISDKRRMAYEGSTSKSNKKRKQKSKDAV